ncbi:transposase [Klebsiella pneumoniae]|uniref:transposase n=1 Tax=Klebsiella pneumoniae TaxID=573 RepID=UPI00240656A3|nr:transposase [Klebsiella pneumoniae]MDF9380915.1 transposase [Klebsiella pneumoniae]
MKDQITHPPDNTDHSVAKQKFRITNWSTYNKALINRGSLTFWLDDEAIQAWYESATPSSRGRPQRYSDLAITTVLVIKRVFRLTLRAAQGYADRNRAVANQRLSGSNARWKWTTEYNRRSIAETAMYRMKQLLGDSLTLRDYDGQVAEAMAMVRALNRMTKAGMPESVRIA